MCVCGYWCVSVCFGVGVGGCARCGCNNNVIHNLGYDFHSISKCWDHSMMYICEMQRPALESYELWCHTGTGLIPMLLKWRRVKLIEIPKINTLGLDRTVYMILCFIDYSLHL